MKLTLSCGIYLCVGHHEPNQESLFNNFEWKLFDVLSCCFSKPNFQVRIPLEPSIFGSLVMGIVGISNPATINRGDRSKLFPYPLKGMERKPCKLAQPEVKTLMNPVT